MKKISKVVLVHDWLTGMRGGEKVLEIFCELFPSADIFTLLHLPGTVSARIESHKIFTSFLQKMPMIGKKYRYYLPWMPSAIESLNLSKYDLVISSSHCVAKGCRPRQDAIHICCCFTPMRYIWDQYQNYFGDDAAFWVRGAMQLLRRHLQQWDVDSSKRVTEFIAISQFVADRIKNYYGRASTVIYPFVDTDFFSPNHLITQSPNHSITQSLNHPFYLIVSALAPYKRIDIAIDAFNKNGKRLKIVGSGQHERELKAQAKSNVEFLDWLSNEDLLNEYQNCKALIFPGTEDFGIVPLEAMACGKPVIAFAGGGTLETLVENKTGLFFRTQNSETLLKAMAAFETMHWHSSEIRQHALKFSKKEFVQNILNFFKEKTQGID